MLQSERALAPEVTVFMSNQYADAKGQDVVVIGAGVAGLAAATALARDGASVTLLERRPFVGGRAYSYPHPALDETIDSQHVVLGCCTNFLELIAQAGAADTIRWYDSLTFLEPATSVSQPNRVPHDRREFSRAYRGDTHFESPNPLAPTESRIHPSALPAPFHNSLSFLRAPMLTLRDKAAIAAGLARFLHGPPESDEESFAAWLRRTHQTDRAIRHFWEPIVAGALNDTFDRCSTKYAGKVFYESFLRSPEGGRLGIPAAPLSDFFQPILAHARTLGVDIHLTSGADRIAPAADGHWRITTREAQIEADAVILAINLSETQRLLSTLAPPAANSPAPLDTAKFVAAPITTIHLWYDREVTDLDHAVLLDTRIQWMFHKSRIRRHAAKTWVPHPSQREGWVQNTPSGTGISGARGSYSARGSYLELVISASWPELDMPREQILASALREVELFFPQVREATLLKSAVLKEARATFSVTPGLDKFRPPQTTAYPNLYVGGDWTATEWPSTMEGAIRSGRLAAGAVTGNRTRYLAPDLPAAGLMRLLNHKGAP
jgi:squalene-associated FAD-dependent desaturase